MKKDTVTVWVVDSYEFTTRTGMVGRFDQRTQQREGVCGRQVEFDRQAHHESLALPESL